MNKATKYRVAELLLLRVPAQMEWSCVTSDLAHSSAPAEFFQVLCSCWSYGLSTLSCIMPCYCEAQKENANALLIFSLDRNTIVQW